MEDSTKYNGWTNYQTWALMLELVGDDMETFYECIRGADLNKSSELLKTYILDYTVGSERFTDEFLELVNYDEVVEALDDWHDEKYCSYCGDIKYDNDHSVSEFF